MEKPTESELRHLYCVENLRDPQISSKLGLSLKAVFLLRKEYGIKGIHPQQRKYIDAPQIEMSARQRSIVFGSLLGDACIKKGSKSRSYMTISHSSKQHGYLLWLYEELKNICPSAPRSEVHHGKYVMHVMSTENRADMFEIRSLIYTPKKTVSEWWCQQLDPLSLAVWYMDDGSLNYVNKSRSYFSFATNAFGQEEHVMLQAVFSRYGINTEIRFFKKPSGIQRNLIISDDSFEKFSLLIKPHVPSCMSYKLPGENHDHFLKSNIEARISENDLRSMYYDKMMTQDEIGRALGVTRQTVTKYMHLFGVEPRSCVDAQLGGSNSRCVRSETNGRFQEHELNAEESETGVQIFEQMRKNGFPYPEIPDEADMLNAVERLCARSVCRKDDGTFIYSNCGLPITTAFCPQIFSMAANGSMSPVEIFNNDDMLLDCIARTFRYARKKSIASIRSGLKTYRHNRSVSNFPPTWAKWSVESVMPDSKNMDVLDFCCGFGGRLIGCYASNKVRRYLGIDPLRDNIASHNRISDLLQRHARSCNNDFSANFVCGAAEDVLPTIEQSFDLVITSPPYFNKERYSSDVNQCYVKYPTYDDWVKNWYVKVVELAWQHVSRGGAMILFASDYQNYPVGATTKSILSDVSKMCPEELVFEIPNLEYLRKSGHKRCDHAYVVRK